MKVRRGLGWMVLVLGGLRVATGLAAPVVPPYQYVFSQRDYTVAPGGTVDVPVYFQEVVFPSHTPVLSPGGVGLLTAGVQVLFSDPPQPSQPARVLSVVDIMENPAFDFPTASVTPSGAKLSLCTLLNPPVSGDEQSPDVYRLLLGTFRFTAGRVAGESTRLRATDYDPGFDDVVTGDMRVLDNSGIYDGMAGITTLPEPGTILMLAAAVLTGVFLWKGHKKFSGG